MLEKTDHRFHVCGIELFAQFQADRRKVFIERKRNQ